ncbi:Caprin-1 [Microtus ochrogaster]|uniref:Caprin-1 n=1 Tax=Microtus ochrogaster TaxID=79684 RepID=A0A8J6GSY4_MICOH|nr:Caprin-1 [Microtus ochrogaster]
MTKQSKVFRQDKKFYFCRRGAAQCSGDRAKRSAPTERTPLLATQRHPCPRRLPTPDVQRLRARTVSAIPDQGARVSLLPSGRPERRPGLAPALPTPTPLTPVPSSTPGPDLCPSRSRQATGGARPDGDRCPGGWRRPCQAPPPARARCPGASGQGEGRASGRPAGGSRACPRAPSCRRRAPPPPPPRAQPPARPLRVLSRVSPRPSPDSLLLSFPPAFFSSLLGLKMPSATSHSGSGSKSSGPPPPSGPSGSEAAAGAAAPASQHPATGTGAVQTEAMKQILGVIDKKLRNLEKKKGKLDDYQERMNKGERLNQDQLDAVSKYQEVTNNLEFAKELQRSFMALSQDIQKTIKKTARREQLMREEAEQKRLKTVLELQYVLDKLGDDEVRTDLKQGLNGVPILSEEELSLLDEFYKLVDPERDMSLRLNEQYEHASIHLWDLLEGKEKPVCGTTYKALKEIVERMFQSSYFDSTHSHQNGLCEEEEAASAPTVEDQVAEAEPEPTEEYTEQSEVESTEYVNRQFMAETQFTSGEKEQVDEWAVETVEVVNSLQQQPQAASPSVPEAHSLAPVAQSDPLVRRQRVQDLMAQMQGPYNFIQFILNLDLPNRIKFLYKQKPHSEGYTASQPLYQPSHATEQRPQKEPMDQIQAAISLNTDQTTASPSLPAASQPQVFQTGTSKPLHSSGINVNAAPFQSMQTVFNMNAPVPPVNEPETLKQQNQYQSSYNQSFPSQPHQVEQTELQQDQLQTVVGTYHASQDQPHQVPGNHQQPPQQNSGFPRSSQPYYNSRGVSRGGSRGARGLMNGYRGPANGFRGGYDGYRPSFSNTPNSGYTQSQFSAPRDYSGYQRVVEGPQDPTEGCRK